MRFFWLIIIVFIITESGLTAVPNRVPYQGLLTDQSKISLKDGLYRLVFKLYPTSQATIAYWTESQTVKSINGLFTVSLGDSSANGFPTMISDSLWLGVTVGTGIELTPRTKLASVPFALRSAIADSSGKSSLALRASVADSAAKTAVSVRSNVADSAVKVAAGASVQTSQLYNSKKTNVIVSVDSIGFVGIGIASPKTKLHIYGTGPRPRITIDGPDTSDVGYDWSSAGVANWSLYRPGNSTDLRFASTLSGNVLSLLQNGFMGLGTITPGRLFANGEKILEISGTGKIGWSRGMLLLDNQNPNIADSVHLGDICFTASNNGLDWGNVNFGGIGMTATNNNGSVMTLLTKNDNGIATPKVTISENGNIGIGNTAPTMKLDVNGTMGVSDKQYPMINLRMDLNTGMGRLHFTRWDGSTYLNNAWVGQFFENYSYKLGFATGVVSGTQNSGNQDSAIVRMTINNEGNVGIGTSNPSFYQHGGTCKVLELSNAGSTINSQAQYVVSTGSVAANSSIGGLTAALPNVLSPNKGVGYASFTTGPNSTEDKPTSQYYIATRGVVDVNWVNRFIVTESGNVGIGTDAPSEKLEVCGSIKASQSITANETCSSSDKRFKTNIETIPDALNKIDSLRGVTYDWNRKDFPERNFSEGKQIGLIAQEVEKVLPELVHTDSDGYKSLSYDKITAVLVEAVKDQKKTIDEQKSLIQEQNDRINSQQQQLESLKHEFELLRSELGK